MLRIVDGMARALKKLRPGKALRFIGLGRDEAKASQYVSDSLGSEQMVQVDYAGGLPESIESSLNGAFLIPAEDETLPDKVLVGETRPGGLTEWTAIEEA